MQHQLVRVPRRHPAVALAPVVRDGVREDRAVPVEAGRGDGALDGFESCGTRHEEKGCQRPTSVIMK